MNLLRFRNHLEQIIRSYRFVDRNTHPALWDECIELSQRFDDENATGNSLAFLVRKCQEISCSLIGIEAEKIGESLIDLLESLCLIEVSGRTLSAPSTNHIRKHLQDSINKTWDKIAEIAFIHDYFDIGALDSAINNRNFSETIQLLETDENI